MSRPRSTRLAAALAAIFAAVSACTSESPTTSRTFCSESKAGLRACPQPSACDTTLAGACGSLDSVLSPSTLDAAQACLESGICSPSYCLTRAQGSAQPTNAHRALADRFCSTCAPEVDGCKDLFYAKQGRLPGVLVLPYAEGVASAVKDACTADPSSCRTEFTTCAVETIARVLGEGVAPDVAACIASGLQRDEGEPPAPDGGPRVLTCTPESCAGCCKDDRCVEGTAGGACGTGGAACQECGAGQECKEGQCVEPCGPNNCKGCCDGEACVIGTEIGRCGEGGEACASCTSLGSSFICSNQQCIDGTCKASCANGCCGASGCQLGNTSAACGKGGEACIDCGYGHACGGERSCELDRTSLWSFYVLSAVIPDKNKSGNAWDSFGNPPDPYVVAYSSLGASSHTGTTTTKNDTLTPSWVEAPLKSVPASELLENVSFEIWDSDYDFDDLIGGCKIGITPEVFDGHVRKVTCSPTASNVSVTLLFKIAPP